jgi:hypothetical protein
MTCDMMMMIVSGSNELLTMMVDALVARSAKRRREMGLNKGRVPLLTFLIP